MAMHDAIISLDLVRIDSRVSNEPVEQSAAPGTGFAVYKPDCLASKIVNLADTLGIFRSDYKSFFPVGEGNDAEILRGKFLSDEGKVEFTRLGIFQMSTGDMDFAFF